MCIALAILAAIAAGSPPTEVVDYVNLSVGDPRVDAKSLRSFRGTWRVLEKKGEGPLVEVERSSEKFDRVRLNGRLLWRDTQHETTGNSGMSDMLLLADAVSFAPVLVEQKDVRDGSLKRIRYGSDGAAIECRGNLCPPNVTAPANGTTTRTVATGVPTFDYWGGSYGLLFATLPLKVGAKFLVPVFHPVQGLIRLKVDVVGKERVNAGGGRTADAFRIITPQTGWIYHVSKQPPYWLRLEYTKKADGVFQVSERV
jgi:hypothetical protein